MAVSDEKYVLTTTFRRTGAGVSTTTWIVPLEDGRVGFWTSSASGKFKRLRSSPRVTLQASDARGRVKEGSAVVAGNAELVTTGPEFDEVQRKVRAKYGVMVPISRFFNTLGHLRKGATPYGDVVVTITTTGSDPTGSAETR